ncbi:MAG: hypothetical protein O0X96_05595 [Methanocorpusculum sp.]|nr:hypothetical protein [Methanocorpusculum sp.]
MTSKKETQRAAGRAEHEQHNAAEDARTGCGDTRATPSRTAGKSTPTDEPVEQIRSLIQEVLNEPEFAGKFRRKKGT